MEGSSDHSHPTERPVEAHSFYYVFADQDGRLILAQFTDRAGSFGHTSSREPKEEFARAFAPTDYAQVGENCLDEKPPSMSPCREPRGTPNRPAEPIASPLNLYPLIYVTIGRPLAVEAEAV